MAKGESGRVYKWNSILFLKNKAKIVEKIIYLLSKNIIMIDNSSNNKRIAKNTLMLYIRMLFTMGVSLYTSRVILQVLGVEDFGIYNVVGGVVGMFSVLSGSLSAAISRFITYELGKGNMLRLKNVFSSAVTIQILLGLLISLIAEIVGLWFLNVKMNIPDNRILAANWVFHFSIITFFINLISIPYNASIIAHEKMSEFAYISIMEVLGKLLIAYLITISPIDKLVFYAISMTLLALIIRLVYGIYCKRTFEECSYNFNLDRSLLREMFGFAGWNFIGASSAVLRDQGGNIIINVFFEPTVNAARGIANQVSYAVQGFVTNFMTALNPQITKSYASGNIDYMMTLIFQGARFSFYILLLLSLPIILNTSYILKLWLGVIPDYTILFVQLALIFNLSESLANPLVTAMLATGNIRKYQIVVGGLQLLNLPISYFFLKMGCAPEIVFIVAIIISVCCEMSRLYMLRTMINLPARSFLKKVYFNVLIVSIVAIMLPYCVIHNIEIDFVNFVWTTILCIFCTLLSILYVGCNKTERLLVFKKLQQINNMLFKI